MINRHTATLRLKITQRTSPAQSACRIKSEQSRVNKRWDTGGGRARGTVMSSAETGYQLGSHAAELERLDLQGRVLAPATRMILQTAGIRRDMRVLDLGSGAGDVRSSPPSWPARRARSSGSINRRMPSRRRPRGPGSVACPTSGSLPVISMTKRLTGRSTRSSGGWPDVRARSRSGAADASWRAALRRRGLAYRVRPASARSLPATPLVGQALSWLREAFTRAGVDPALGPGL